MGFNGNTAMNTILDVSFFERPTLEVAETLIGQMLCRQLPDGRVIRTRLTEIEAYDGPEDQACHAHKGRTQRTETMFGPAGHFYVYLCYGMHWMLNVVTGPAGYPAAILIRGTELVQGPGRLTKVLLIDKALNAKPAGQHTGLWFEPAPPDLPKGKIQRTPRIGIDYAGELWRNKPWRWLLTY